MANHLLLGLAAVLATGICIALCVVAARYLRATRRWSQQDAEASFEKDVEWQLQSEFRNAIGAASIPAPPATSTLNLRSGLETRELRPLLPAPKTVTFAHGAAGSRPDLRAYAALHDHANNPPQHQQRPQINGTLTPPLQSLEAMGEADGDFHINPKQFQRILKRRMTRKLIEDYFRSRAPVLSPVKVDGVDVDIGSRGRLGRASTRHAVVVV